MSEMLEIYLEDLKDSLLLFNESMMKVQKGDTGPEVINAIFRVAHTIKGNSAGIEFNNIESVMHKVEDILQEVREDKRQLEGEVLKMLFECLDFLEDSAKTIISVQHDRDIDVTKLLAKVTAIKEGNKMADGTGKEEHLMSQEANNRKRNSDEFRLPAVDIELVDVIIDNCKRGYAAYRVSVEFSPACQMKAVRTWMVFEKIDSHSTFVFSVPSRGEDSDFKSGTFDFDGYLLEIFVITEKDIDVLKNDIMSTSDVIEVKTVHMDIEWLKKERERISAEKKIRYLIKDVEVNLLDMEKREVNATALKRVEETLTDIATSGENALDDYVKNMIGEILRIVKCFEENESRVGSNDVEVVAFLTHKLENMIEDNALIYDTKLTDEIDNIIKATMRKFEGSGRIGEILVENKVINNADVDEILLKQKEKYPDLKFGQIAVKEDKVSAYQMMKTMKEQTVNKDVIKENGFIRVPVNKVDGLMDMLGELLILNAQMETKVSELENVDMGLNNVLSRSAKIIRGIQGLSMSLRMVEIKPMLHRLTRIARDTGAELKKNIVVNIEGEDTEIDRSASEKLFDPLMHLVRNAVSHGIEDESDRKKLGKKPEGVVTLRVYSKRGSVYIEVEDDGKGIDIERVYKKAKAQGLIEDGREYSEEEIIRFIFLPGFSTQENINSISGRGVGMNVVESEINKIGGKVDVVNRPGRGSTVILRVPLNLAVVNGTIIESCGGRYIVPTLFIKEFYIPQKENWVSMQGTNKAIRLRDSVIPVITAQDIFGEKCKGSTVESNQVIILELEQKYLAFPVDKIISRQEIVSKPLDREFAGVGFASGASILGDGQVSVILDVEAMFRMNHK